MGENVTYQQVCETIEAAGILRKPDGSKPTAREIWNYSPTGELAMISYWYQIAKQIVPTAPSAAPWPSEAPLEPEKTTTRHDLGPWEAELFVGDHKIASISSENFDALPGAK